MRGILSLELDHTSDGHCDARGNCEGQRAPFTYVAAGGQVQHGEVVDVDGLNDALAVDATLAACVQLSLSTRADSAVVAPPPKLVVSAHGLNLHAATAVDGRDRRRVERLCKYLLRPPFSRDSVHRLPDGRVALDLPRKGRSIEMTAEQFVVKLVALVPPPFFRIQALTSSRYHWPARSLVENHTASWPASTLGSMSDGMKAHPPVAGPSDIVRFGGGFLLVAVTLVALVGVLAAVGDVVHFFRVRRYQPASATVTKAWVIAARDLSSKEPKSRAVANVDYEFDGEAISVKELPLGPIGSRQAANDVVARYPVGGEVTVYVDPDDVDDPEIDNDPPLLQPATLGLLIPSLIYFVYFAGWLVPVWLRNRRAGLTAAP